MNIEDELRLTELFERVNEWGDTSCLCQEELAEYRRLGEVWHEENKPKQPNELG